MKTWLVPFMVIGVLVGIWYLTGPHPGVVASGHQKAISRDAAMSLASLSYEEGKLDEALRYFEEAAEYDPENLDIVSGWATVLMAQAGKEQNPGLRRQMLQGAIAGFIEVVEKRPGIAQDWRNLAAALHNAGMLEEALAALQRAEETGG